MSEEQSGMSEQGEQSKEAVFRTFFSLQYPYLAYFLFYFLTSAFAFRYLVEFKLVGIFKVLRQKLEFGVFWIQVLSSLFFLYMAVSPLAVCFYWGFTLYQNPAFSPQLGWGVSLVSSFVIFLYLALNNWYGHQWAVTPFTRACFYCSFVCSTAYCVVVIFLPEKFSYTGCTAIFFAINFLCISKILQTRSDAKLVSVNIFLQELLEEDIQDLPWHQKVEWSFYKTQQSQQKRRIFYIFSYFVILLTYAAVLCFYQTDQIRFVGFLNIFFLMACDAVVISYKNKMKDKQIIQRTSFREIILLVIRIQLCFYEDYWFIVQGFLFYLVNIIFWVSVFTNIISKDQIQDENDIESLYQMCPELQVRVAAELQCLRVEKLTAEVIGLQQQKLFQKRKRQQEHQNCFQKCIKKLQKSKYFQYVALFVLYVMFGVNGYVCSLDYQFFGAKKIRVNVKKKIRIDNIGTTRGLEEEMSDVDDAEESDDPSNSIRKTLYYEFDQWTAGVLSAFLIITTMILFIWAYSYIKNSFRMTKAQGVFVVFGTILILLIGLAFGEVQGEDYVLTYTSFAIIPLTLTTAISFFGIWKKNDYHLYEVYDSKAGDENQEEDVKTFVQMFFFNIRKFLLCEYRARTHRDKLALIAILTNQGTLILYGILTAYYFQPWWVGYTISSWIAIIEFTILAFIKYYQNYFQITFMVQLCCLAALVLYAAWCITVGLFLAKENEYQSDVITVIYVASVLGYMFFFSAIMSLLKYTTVKSIEKMPRGHKILFTLSASVIALYGAVIVRATKYYTVGILIFMGGLYLISYFWWRKHYKLITKLFALAIILLSALKMVYFTSPTVKLESLSISLLTIFFFFLVFFLQKQSINKERLGNQIFLYSKSVLPVLKYLPSQRQMRPSNSEVIYFGFAMSSILVWTFMAGVLFDSHDRYIAISATALVLILSYIYINNRIKQASYFQKPELLRLNQFILDETIAEAVALKKIWREIGKQRKTILDCQLNIVNGGDIEGGNLQYMGLLGKQMQKQEFKRVIQTHQEWKDFEKRAYQKLGGAFYFVCILQPRLYSSVNDYSDANLIKETKKDLSRLSKGKLFDRVWKISQKSQQEQLYNIQFWAYFAASISMKASLLIEEEKSKIQTLIEAFKAQKDEEIALQLEDGSFHVFLKEDKTREEFVQFIQEYYARHSDKIEQRVSELISQQQESQKDILVQDDSLLKDMVYGSITENRLNETEQEKEAKLAEKETESKTNEQHKDGFLFHLREPAALPEILDEQSSGVQSLGVSSFNKTLTKSLAKSVLAQKDDTVQSSYHNPFKRKQLKIFSQKRRLEGKQKEEQKIFQDQLVANQELLKKRNEFQDNQRQKELQKQLKRKKQDTDFISLKNLKTPQTSSKREQSKLAQLLMKGRRSRLFSGTQIIKELASREESFDKQDCDRYERILRNAGDNIYEDNEEVELFEDKTFPKAVALGKDKEKYDWIRLNEMDLGSKELKVLEPQLLREIDIQQGQIGNCYFLSALSVIAHTKPHLIENIFHKKSRKINQKGLYVMRFFKNRQPVIIHIDDFFAVNKQKKHAFCKVKPQNIVWPMLLEKGFAKLYGSYQNTDGGLVESAFADITNGAPDRFSLRDEEVKRMYNSGELWENLKMWIESGTYLLGAGSPRGSNSQQNNPQNVEVSPIGIIQGHAYGILDVFEFEGIKLIQLRNPWGKQEWKGAWSKKSAQWTERRKRIISERMRQKEDQNHAGNNSQIYKNWEDLQGVFWMSLNDFMSNFEDLSICRFFDAQWVEVSYRGEWSTQKNQAGGCTNFDSVAENPQLSVQVYGLGQDVEIFAYLSIQQDLNCAPKRMGIGFELYQLGGKKITSRFLPKVAYANSGGYKMATEVSLDGTLKTQKEPYTLLISTFNPGEEASFIFTIWYKKSTGSVHLQELE